MLSQFRNAFLNHCAGEIGYKRAHVCRRCLGDGRERMGKGLCCVCNGEGRLWGALQDSANGAVTARELGREYRAHPDHGPFKSAILSFLTKP